MPSLGNWNKDMSHFNEELGVTAEDIASIYELAKLRNERAHPQVTLKQVKDYLIAVLMEHDSFGQNTVASSHF